MLRKMVYQSKLMLKQSFKAEQEVNAKRLAAAAQAEADAIAAATLLLKKKVEVEAEEALLQKKTRRNSSII
jgi:small subunit ribosomal protein S16